MLQLFKRWLQLSLKAIAISAGGVGILILLGTLINLASYRSSMWVVVLPLPNAPQAPGFGGVIRRVTGA